MSTKIKFMRDYETSLLGNKKSSAPLTAKFERMPFKKPPMSSEKTSCELKIQNTNKESKREFDKLKSQIKSQSDLVELLRREIENVKNMYGSIVKEVTDLRSDFCQLKQMIPMKAKEDPFSMDAKRKRIINERRLAHKNRMNTEMFVVHPFNNTNIENEKDQVTQDETDNVQDETIINDEMFASHLFEGDEKEQQNQEKSDNKIIEDEKQSFMPPIVNDIENDNNNNNKESSGGEKEEDNDSDIDIEIETQKDTRKGH